MKFKEDRPFATPEAAERKLLELANAVEPDHAGRLPVEIINRQFRDAGGQVVLEIREEGARVILLSSASGAPSADPCDRG
jgi:hypothetical protein